MTKPYSDIIAEEMHKAGWSYGYTAAFIEGEMLYVVDAHKDDGHRYVVYAETLMTAFMELRKALNRLEEA